MVRLDIEKINSRSPYRVLEKEPGKMLFSTDFGIHYYVTFTEDDMLHSSEAYQFSLLNLEHKPSPRDPKIREVVVAIIQDFFDSNQSTMLYTCETGDGKQDMRNRLFAHWFRAFANEEEYYYRHMKIQDEDITNYITMILRRDNPDAAKVLEEWDYNELAFSEKPQEY